MADEIVIGKIGLTPKGEYVSGELYDILDMVSHEGNSYVSKIQNNDIDVTNTEAWLLAAEKGEDGEKGDTGDTFTFEDLTTEQKEELKGDVIIYNSMTESEKDDFASRVPITGVIEEGNTQAVSGGEVFNALPKRGDNLFDGNYINASVLTDGTYMISATGLSILLKVEPLTKYFVKKDLGDRLRFIELSDYPTITDTPSSQYSLDYTTAGAAAKTTEFITKENCKYILLMVSATIEDIKTQITKSDLPFFIGYDYDIQLSVEQENKILDRAFGYINAKNALVAENLFSGNYISAVVLTDFTYTTSVTSRSIIEPVVENVDYIFKKEGGNRDRYVFLSEYPNLTSTATSDFVISSGGTLNSQQIKTPVGARYIMWTVDANSFEPPITIKRYFDILIDSSELSTFNSVPNNIQELYKIGVQQDSSFLNTANQQVVIDVYEDLRVLNPEYLMRSSIGQSGDGLEMYMYKLDANLFNIPTNAKIKKKKVFIEASIHGYEEMAAYSTALFFKDILTVRNKVNDWLLYNYEYFIIPVANPDGFNLHIRENANGVDLNRDFINKTQIETNNIIDAINSVDFDFYLSIHNIANPPSLFYVRNSDSTNLAYNTFFDIRDYWISEYDLAPDYNIGNITFSGNTTTSTNYAISQIGKPAITLESPWRQGFDTSKYGAITTRTAVEFIGNTLINIFRALNIR